MRAMWTGNIVMGMVTVPVKLYSATQEHGLEMHQVHPADGGRISVKRVCKDCGEEVSYGCLGRGHVDPATGEMTVLSPNELAALPGAGSKEVTLLEFVDPVEVDPMLLDTPYYLRPDNMTRKRNDVARPNRAYALLVEALTVTGKAAIGRMTLRTRESLVLITAREGFLLAHKLRWADETRAPEFEEAVMPDVTVSAAERAQALALVEAMSVKFDIDRHHDQREVALSELVEAKRDGYATIYDLTARLTERAS